MKVPLESSLVISFDVPDLRSEFTEPYAFRDEPELAQWWASRSDEEIAQIGHYILNGDYIWNVWKTELLDAMITIKQRIERNEK